MKIGRVTTLLLSWVGLSSVALGAPAPPAPPRTSPATRPAPPASRSVPPRTVAPPVDPCARQARVPSAAKAMALRALLAGRKSLEAANYVRALACFEEANRHYPSPKLHFNIAQANHELGRPLAALSHYEHFLKHYPKARNPAMWNLAYKRAFQLQGQVATLQLQVNVPGAEVIVDSHTVGRSPLAKPVRLLGGPHTLVVLKPGYAREVVRLTLEAGKSVNHRVVLLTEAEKLAKQRRYQHLAEERHRVQERLRLERLATERRQRERRRVFLITGWSLVGAGAALFITGGILGGLSIYETDRAEPDNDNTYYSEVRPSERRAQRYAPAAYAGLVCGAAIAAAGGILVWIGKHRGERAVAAPSTSPAATPKPTVSGSPLLGPGQVGASLKVTF